MRRREEDAAIVGQQSPFQTIDHGEAIYALRFAPNGTTIAAGDNSGNVDFWDADSGRQLAQTIAGGGGAVASVSFDPAGRRLMTTSSDGNIRLWDLTDDKLIGVPLSGGSGFGWGTFYPDGHHLIVVYPSGTGIVWDADPASWSAQACRVARRNLTRAEWREFLPQRPYRRVCAAAG